jgi:hypothetical protein
LPFHRGRLFANGEMSEWSKEHAWKVCVLQKGTVGSNPTLSAENEAVNEGWQPLFFIISEIFGDLLVIFIKMGYITTNAKKDRALVPILL